MLEATGGAAWTTAQHPNNRHIAVFMVGGLAADTGAGKRQNSHFPIFLDPSRDAV